MDSFMNCIDSLNPIKGKLQYEAGENNDGKGTVIDYDVPFLLSYGWIIPFRGSMFTSRLLLSVSIMIIMVTIFSQCACNDTKESTAVRYCVPLSQKVNERMSDTVTLLGCTSFVVGIYTITLLQHWWNFRMHMLGYFNGNKEAMIVTASALANSKLVNQNPALAIEAKQACHTIFRYLNLANYLTIFNANRYLNYEFLLHKGLLTKSEYELIKTTSGSPNVAYCWINSRLQKLANSGFLGGFPGTGYATLRNSQSTLGAARSQCIAVMTFIDTQLPYPFMQLVTMVQNGCLLQILIASSTLIAQGFQYNDYGKIFVGYMTTITFTTVFRSLLFLYHKVQNPIGQGSTDFPVTTYLNEAEKEMLYSMNNIFSISLNSRYNSRVSTYSADECHSNNVSKLHFAANSKRVDPDRYRTGFPTAYSKNAVNAGSYAEYPTGCLTDDEEEYDDEEDEEQEEDDRFYGSEADFNEEVFAAYSAPIFGGSRTNYVTLPSPTSKSFAALAAENEGDEVDFAFDKDAEFDSSMCLSISMTDLSSTFDAIYPTSDTFSQFVAPMWIPGLDGIIDFSGVEQQQGK